MKISDNGIKLIVEFEGMVLRRYLDAAGLPTIGIGHLITKQDKIPSEITEEQAFEIFRNDVKGFEAAVNTIVNVGTTQNEFDAMVSLAFNIGANAFKNSSVARYYAQGKDLKAADAFLLWNKAGGRVLQGLVNRREKERDYFLGRS